MIIYANGFETYDYNDNCYEIYHGELFPFYGFSTINNNVVRSGNYSLYCGGWRSHYSARIENKNEIYVFFAFNLESETNANPNIFKWMNEDNTIGSLQYQYSTNTFKVLVGSTIVATGSLPLSFGVWYKIELHIKLSSSAGIITTKIDNVQDINYSGNTIPTGTWDTDSINVLWWGSDIYIRYYLDDILVNDTSGTSNNSWINNACITLYEPSSFVNSGFTTTNGINVGYSDATVNLGVYNGVPLDLGHRDIYLRSMTGNYACSNIFRYPYNDNWYINNIIGNGVGNTWTVTYKYKTIYDDGYTTSNNGSSLSYTVPTTSNLKGMVFFVEAYQQPDNCNSLNINIDGTETNYLLDLEVGSSGLQIPYYNFDFLSTTPPIDICKYQCRNSNNNNRIAESYFNYGRKFIYVDGQINNVTITTQEE